jgi:hypothetical protein
MIGARLLAIADGNGDGDGDGDEVMFTTLTFFDSMEAVRGFAGERPEMPVLEDEARRVLSRWDDRVRHHEVVADLE